MKYIAIKQVKDKIKERMSEVEAKVDGLTTRERVLILFGSIFVLYMIFDSFIFGYLDGKTKSYDKKIAAVQREIKVFEKEKVALNQKIKTDPANVLQQKINELTKDNKSLQKNIDRLTNQLVLPKDMSKLLYKMLKNKTNMKVLKLENLPEQSVLQKEEKIVTDGDKKIRVVDDKQLEIYKHSMFLEVRGTYLETVRLLEELEGLNWKLIWEEINYKVDEHPYAIVSVVVSTLSFNKEWIGV